MDTACFTPAAVHDSGRLPCLPHAMPVAPCGEEALSCFHTETGHMADIGSHFPGTILKMGRAGGGHVCCHKVVRGHPTPPPIRRRHLVWRRANIAGPLV